MGPNNGIRQTNLNLDEKNRDPRSVICSKRSPFEWIRFFVLIRHILPITTITVRRGKKQSRKSFIRITSTSFISDLLAFSYQFILGLLHLHCQLYYNATCSVERCNFDNQQ